MKENIFVIFYFLLIVSLLVCLTDGGSYFRWGFGWKNFYPVQVRDGVPLLIKWNHDAASATATTAYNIYMSQMPGIVPNGTPNAIVTAGDALEWTTTLPGKWYFVVTATDGIIESEPSNELFVYVTS